MANLWQKLTGKAPLVEDSVNDTESQTETKDETSKVEDYRKVKQQEDMKTVFLWSVPILICLVIIFATGGIFKFFVNKDARNRIAELDVAINDTKNSIDALSMEKKAQDNQANELDRMSTYINEDTSAHDAMIEEVFKKYTTWSDGSTYEDLRNEAMNEFDVNSTSPTSFMTVVLPQQAVYRDKDTGRVFYQIDETGLNSHFDSLESYVLTGSTSAVGTKYAAIVTVSSKTAGDHGRTLTTYKHYYTTYTVSNDILLKDSIRVSLIADTID